MVEDMWREPAPEGLGVSCSHCKLCPQKALGKAWCQVCGGGSREGLQTRGAAGVWLKGRRRCRAVRRGTAEQGEAEEGGLATVDRTPV